MNTPERRRLEEMFSLPKATIIFWKETKGKTMQIIAHHQIKSLGYKNLFLSIIANHMAQMNMKLEQPSHILKFIFPDLVPQCRCNEKCFVKCYDNFINSEMNKISDQHGDLMTFLIISHPHLDVLEQLGKEFAVFDMGAGLVVILTTKLNLIPETWINHNYSCFRNATRIVVSQYNEKFLNDYAHRIVIPFWNTKHVKRSLNRLNLLRKFEGVRWKHLTKNYCLHINDDDRILWLDMFKSNDGYRKWNIIKSWIGNKILERDYCLSRLPDSDSD